MTWRTDDKRGGRRITSTRKSGSRALRITRLRDRIWMAEHIGWPALAESFRRELRSIVEAV